jgi:hypothetical protein
LEFIELGHLGGVRVGRSITAAAVGDNGLEHAVLALHIFVHFLAAGEHLLGQILLVEQQCQVKPGDG